MAVQEGILKLRWLKPGKRAIGRSASYYQHKTAAFAKVFGVTANRHKWNPVETAAGLGNAILPGQCR